MWSQVYFGYHELKKKWITFVYLEASNEILYFPKFENLALEEYKHYKITIYGVKLIKHV